MTRAYDRVFPEYTHRDKEEPKNALRRLSGILRNWRNRLENGPIPGDRICIDLNGRGSLGAATYNQLYVTSAECDMLPVYVSFTYNSCAVGACTANVITNNQNILATNATLPISATPNGVTFSGRANVDGAKISKDDLIRVYLLVPGGASIVNLGVRVVCYRQGAIVQNVFLG